MFQKGERVRLVVPMGGFKPGAEGTVDVVFDDGNVAILIDKDENGKDVTPFPLPPAPASNFEPV